MEHTDKLLVVCGPTATGKTALAVRLAKTFNGELVSADSRQVYREMNIGTGKDYEDLRGEKIWMYDIVNPDEAFSISQYKMMAIRAISDIHARGKLPIIVGGSGLYIKSLVSDLETLSIPPDNALRTKLQDASISELQTYIHPDVLSGMNNSDKNNPRRLIRKIEITNNAKKISHQSVLFDTLTLGLNTSMEEIERRIKHRISKRIQQGVLCEFETLRKKYGNIPALQAPGYKSVDAWQTDEIAYAKRQMTWFKKDTTIRWFDATDINLIEKVEHEVFAWYTISDER